MMALVVPASAGPFALGPVQLHCEFSTTANSCHRLGGRSHTQAHYKVYDLFRNRESLREKDPEAVERILMAAEQDDIDAQYDLGHMYSLGWGVPQDYDAAAKWWRKAAEQNDALAQYFLGQMYAYARGVPQDKAEAINWFVKAAERGYILAYSRLRRIFGNGETADEETVDAVKWFRKNAERGDVEAQYQLGEMHRFGQGVPKDNVLAHKWLSIAAHQGRGRTKAWRSRERLAKSMTPNQIAEAQRTAHEWVEMHQR
jgi:TPR repeat protein